MNYVEKRSDQSFELEMLEDGVRYVRKSKDENFSSFITYDKIGDNTSKYKLNKNSWVDSYNYKYFLVIAFGFSVYSLITTGQVDSMGYLFLFVAFIFWLFTVTGKEKYVTLMGSMYGDSIVLFDSIESEEAISEIKDRRNKFLKHKYLNEDGSLKDIYQNEEIIRNMSLYGLVSNDLVSKVGDHNAAVAAAAQKKYEEENAQ